MYLRHGPAVLLSHCTPSNKNKHVKCIARCCRLAPWRGTPSGCQRGGGGGGGAQCHRPRQPHARHNPAAHAPHARHAALPAECGDGVHGREPCRAHHPPNPGAPPPYPPKDCEVWALFSSSGGVNHFISTCAPRSPARTPTGPCC